MEVSKKRKNDKQDVVHNLSTCSNISCAGNNDVGRGDEEGRHTALLNEQSHSVYSVLYLLRFLAGPDVPIESWLLESGGRPRRRWTPSGELEDFRADDLGLDPAVLDLLQDHKQFGRILDMLETSQYIRRNRTTITLGTNKICQLDQFSHGQTQDFWRKQALILACFFFAGCEYTHW